MRVALGPIGHSENGEILLGEMGKAVFQISAEKHSSSVRPREMYNSSDFERTAVDLEYLIGYTNVYFIPRRDDSLLK